MAGPVIWKEPAERMQPDARVADGQRARITQAVVHVVAERGFAGATVKRVTGRAGVSSRTFYECFESLEECFAEILDEALAQATRLITDQFAAVDRWEDGILAAIAAVLAYLDSEPLLARVWFVESMAAGPGILKRREQNLALLSSTIVGPWADAAAEAPNAIAVAGIMASVLGLIHGRLVRQSAEPLIELLGPLMGLITAPYLGRHAAAREIRRGEEMARLMAASHTVRNAERARDSRSELPFVPAAHAAVLARSPRRRECLVFIAAHPGASNHEIAVGIGIKHQAQISRLLADLAREQLAAKHSEGPGKRNSWRLTTRGEEILRSMTAFEGHSLGGPHVYEIRADTIS